MPQARARQQAVQTHAMQLNTRLLEAPVLNGHNKFSTRCCLGVRVPCSRIALCKAIGRRDLPTFRRCVTINSTISTLSPSGPPYQHTMALAAKTQLRAASRAARPSARNAVKVCASHRVDRYSKNDIIVSPSILSANFSKLGEEVSPCVIRRSNNAHWWLFYTKKHQQLQLRYILPTGLVPELAIVFS